MVEYFKETPVTMALISINVIVYIITVIFPDSVYYIAMYVPFVFQGMFWTPFTEMFAHGGIMHLGMNMLSLWALGNVLEPFFETRNFLILYFVSGLVGSLFSILYDLAVASNVLFLGASGAIFGLFAAYGVIMLDTYLEEKKRRGNSTWVAELKKGLSSFAALLIVNIAFSLTPGIGWQAHLGGFVSGAIICFIMLHSMKKSVSRQ